MDNLMRDKFIELVHDLLWDDEDPQRANMIIDCADEYAESMKSQWIPVSERLPVPYEDVWCCSDVGQIVGYCDATGFWIGRGELGLIVTAWMPKPESYQGDSNE